MHRDQLIEEELIATSRIQREAANRLGIQLAPVRLPPPNRHPFGRR